MIIEKGGVQISGNRPFFGVLTHYLNPPPEVWVNYRISAIFQGEISGFRALGGFFWVLGVSGSSF